MLAKLVTWFAQRPTKSYILYYTVKPPYKPLTTVLLLQMRLGYSVLQVCLKSKVNVYGMKHWMIHCILYPSFRSSSKGFLMSTWSGTFRQYFTDLGCHLVVVITVCIDFFQSKGKGRLEKLGNVPLWVWHNFRRMWVVSVWGSLSVVIMN